MDAEAAAPFSSSAYWIAAVRARESARPDRLFEDPFAEHLAGALGEDILRRSEETAGAENPFLPVRTRFIDDLILGTAVEGVQIVLLGAGLDTRAFRLPLPAASRVFELDRPSLLDRKDALLARFGARPLALRIPIRCDLAEDWWAYLLSHGFDPNVRAIWIAEGLLFYLAGPDVDGLLRRTRALSVDGSAIVADVFGSGIMAAAGMPAYVAAAERRGLPSPFWTDDPQRLLEDAGWQTTEIVEADDALATYGRLPRGDARPVNMSSTRAWFVAGRAQTAPHSAAQSPAEAR